jgi:hypothetical protein
MISVCCDIDHCGRVYKLANSIARLLEHLFYWHVDTDSRAVVCAYDGCTFGCKWFDTTFRGHFKRAHKNQSLAFIDNRPMYRQQVNNYTFICH